MKANVYVVKVNGQWQAWLTIAPAVDRRYWLGHGFREDGRVAHTVAESVWFWREALPLGDACSVVELWERQTSANISERSVLGQLHACVEKVRLEASAAVGARAEGIRLWRRLLGRRHNAEERAGDNLRSKVELWERAGLGGAEWNGEPDEIRERALSDADARVLAARAKHAAGLLQGRALVRSEVHALLEGASGPGAAAGWSGVLQLAALLGQVRLRGAVAVAAAEGGRADAMKRRRRERSCLRCGSGEALLHDTACAACGRKCAYCTACITMGRSRECELLVLGGSHSAVGGRVDAGKKLSSVRDRLMHWSLSPAQAEAAKEALCFVEDGSNVSRNTAGTNRKFLLWAVTGAGKTEMIFPLVESVLLRGGKALIATPRRDVVIELDPRIRKAFPDATVVTLYGGSAQRWECGDITLSTTHQLLRFYQGFDLVIIDEIDAFPFHGDPILHFAADKSCAPGAARLLLSAIPPQELQREAKRGRLPHARVPVRYHRHPLPVPNLLRMMTVKQMLQSRKLPASLAAAMRQSLARGAQLFVFVQQIIQTEPMALLLRTVLKQAAIEATSSQDNERAVKVQQFRNRDIRVLVTTTILERGVTIPRSDVYIMDADGRLFDEASLVQMAGRAGRSADDPYGKVYFCSRERNNAQVAAVRHIRTMNRIARRKGYLLTETDKLEVSK